MRRVFRSGFVIATWLLAAACDESTGTTGTLQITLNPGSLTMSPGGSGTATVTIVRGGGFAGPVTLTTAGLPFGVNVAIAPSQLAEGVTSATLSVGAVGVSGAGAFSFTVTASGLGVEDASTSLHVTVTPPPEFRLLLPIPSLAVTAGTDGSMPVNVIRSNYAGEIAFALLGPPAGVTASFAPSSTTGNSTLLTVDVAPIVPAGSYALAVEATAPGLEARTVFVTLEVLPVPGSFTLNPNPLALTMPRGNTATIDIALVRNNYTGPITITFDNPSAGITGSVTPASTTGNSATFTFNVALSVPGGVYQLRLRATATGLADRVAFVQVTVTEPVGAAVRYQFCDPSLVPVLFAYQDGGSAWTVLNPTVANGVTRFDFTLVQDRGAVFMLHQNSPTPGRYTSDVLFASATELARDGIARCLATQGVRDLVATILGVAIGQFATVSIGPSSVVFDGDLSLNPVTFSGVPAGLVDVVGARSTPGSLPDRMVIMRDIDLPHGSTLPAAVAFNNPSALIPTVGLATVNNVGSDFLTIATDLATANGRSPLWSDLGVASPSPRLWPGLHPVDMLATDLHGLTATATTQAGDGLRTATRFVGPVSNQTLNLGAALTPPTIVPVAPGPYPRYRISGPVAAEYDRGVSVVLGQSVAGSTVRMVATSAWLQQSSPQGTYDIVMPDVGGLAGLPAAARLGAGVNIVLVTAFGHTGDGLAMVTPVLNAEARSAARTTTVTVPN